MTHKDLIFSSTGTLRRQELKFPIRRERERSTQLNASLRKVNLPVVPTEQTDRDLAATCQELAPPNSKISLLVIVPSTIPFNSCYQVSRGRWPTEGLQWRGYFRLGSPKRLNPLLVLAISATSKLNQDPPVSSEATNGPYRHQICRTIS